MTRIVLRHLSGSKTQHTEEFPIDDARNLLIGRDPAAQVRFDPERDDVVGRQHARLVQDPADPFTFSLVDLGSRNGTFVNRQRVAGTAVLTPGDVVRLGAGGPEFVFEMSPVPAHLIKATRLMTSGTTREAGRSTQSATKAGVNVGKQTVERLIGQASNNLRRHAGIAVAAVLLLSLFSWTGYAWWDSRRPICTQPGDAGCRPATPMSTTELAAKFSPSTVLVEFAWKLVFTGTGEQLYHEYSFLTDKNGRTVIVDGQPLPPVPVFERLDDGRLVPRLTLERGAANQNAAIACGGSGSGFAVTTDGFILTNRHVGTNWESIYKCFPADGYAFVYERGKRQPDVARIETLRPHWVPALDGRELSGKRFEGQNIFLDVTFKLNKLRFPATVARVSDRADVALVKINSPMPVKKLDLYDNYDTVAVGNATTVMGYPGVSPDILVSIDSMDPIARQKRWITIPDATVTPGTIGRVIRGQMKASQGTVLDYASEMGDVYQLTINTTGGGNSGGPVLDDLGRVIGIFTYGKSDAGGTQISFAVPIRYGIELLGTSPAVTR